MAKQNINQKGEANMEKNKSTVDHKEENMNGITFKVEKMYLLPNADSLKAFCDVSINDVIVIRGVRLIKGKRGLFVSMPQERGADKRWHDQVVCKTASIYDAFVMAVMNHYHTVDSAGA